MGPCSSASRGSRWAWGASKTEIMERKPGTLLLEGARNAITVCRRTLRLALCSSLLATQGQQGPPSKRKRPADITVPERTGGLGSVEGLGGGVASGAAITPKSPYEDSLAALHEIATSPSTFELTSMREQQPLLPPRMSSGGGGGGLGGGAGGAGKGRARPRLHVDVPGQEPLGGGLGAGVGAASTPGVLLNDNPLLQVGKGARRMGWGEAVEWWCAGQDFDALHH